MSTHRGLQEDGALWEQVYAGVVLLVMFAALLSDRVGADSVMISALTAFLAAEVITIKEGLEGFANEGLLTVLVLFVVAEGINKTGALDWYMTKLLGHPSTVGAAQLRLMIPVAIVSAFLNNTPVVVVMIPIVQRWAKNLNMPVQQLMIPLSFATILGGTCTLIGTSTNLVVQGLLERRYPGEGGVGLFDLGQYGVPVAMVGIAYILLFSPCLLPGGTSSSMETTEDLLLGARLTKWSPAAGRTVQRSGLRDTGGIYLVSVHRATTGNVHRAVSNDFVLSVGDILYFTGLVESFGEFCEEHGLEVVTNEVQDDFKGADEALMNEKPGVAPLPISPPRTPLTPLAEDMIHDFPVVEVGMTKESLLQADDAERLRSINRMTDLIRGDESYDDAVGRRVVPARSVDPAKIVVTADKDLVIVGINAKDRTGLMLDISKGLLRLNLQLHHTEAAVRAGRSISIWRCEPTGTELPDLEEIWSVLNALLSNESGIEAIKKRGLRVIRARVIEGSRLVGKTASEMDFRSTYKAAIVAVQQLVGGTTSSALSSVRLNVGDILVLQASDDSPLVEPPPTGFYEELLESALGSHRKGLPKTPSVQGFVSRVAGRGRRSSDPPSMDTAHGASSGDDTQTEHPTRVGSATEAALESGDMLEVNMTAEREAVWRDLQTFFQKDDGDAALGGSREFLTAMQVGRNSKLAGKTVSQLGLTKMPGVFLVSVERSSATTFDAQSPRNDNRDARIHQVSDNLSRAGSDYSQSGTMSFSAIEPEEPLREGDVLWFSGSASAVGNLRKIPGLVSTQREEVDKINEKVQDRRLVQAVIARKGPLVGKNVKELRFRTRYGAAVIAVHREGKRVHEHPGRVKLQAGDVLLLEAGPGFIAKSKDNDNSFALFAEVEDSAPPRLSLLLPALLIAVGMLVVFTAGLTDLITSALVASFLMVVLGILSEQETRDAVNWDIYISVGSAFGIGTALVNSGLAGSLAGFLVDVGTAIGIGDAGLLGAVYFATFLISSVVTNNAAAALVFPIAMDAAELTNTDLALMAYTIMLGASASFMTPFGYTTNLLIYGPGRYKTMDFLRFGTPMQIVLWICSIGFLMVPQWYISWLGAGLALLLAGAVRAGWSLPLAKRTTEAS